MRIAITGASGQLGQAFQQRLGFDHEIIPLGHADLELGHPHCVEVVAATRADLVIHPAAFTNVDGCARDPERAYRVNGLGTRYVALACRRMGAALVYVSTNEVFDGASARPYLEYDTPHPINPYGSSKYIGEQAVRELVPEHYVARVAWLYGGARNFIRTVLRLASERDSLSMVADEVGSPTYTADVATAVAKLIETRCYGTYHLVNQGVSSRHELAAETLRLVGRSGFDLRPITLAEYQRASAVPPHTPLQNLAAADLGITLRPWQAALEEYLGTL